MAKTSLSGKAATYLPMALSDLKRLRQSLTRAWKHSKAGLSYEPRGMTANQFATLLQSCGLECRRSDVENGAKRPFEAKTCPPTPAVYTALEKLKIHFPTLQVDEFVDTSGGDRSINLLPAIGLDTPTMRRIPKPKLSN